MTTPALLLLLNAAATFYMIGLIWFVQRVHYPLLAGVGGAQFVAYENAHMSRTNLVVGPPMLVEAATTVALLVFAPPGMAGALIWLGLGLLAIVWLSTWLLQVPRHRQLLSGFDATAHRRLVSTNWIRTAAWSLRGVLVLWMLLSAEAV